MSLLVGKEGMGDRKGIVYKRSAKSRFFFESFWSFFFFKF